jgi:amino-acid N-acetyltransferase
MIQKAHIHEARAIRDIINAFAQKDLLLSLSLSEIYDHIRDFFVCLDTEGEIKEDTPPVIGVCALNIIWEDLAEIRSLAVLEKYRERGIGSSLVQACLQEARGLGISKVFCLTINMQFFSHLGFKVIDKSELPHKIWSDCIKCAKFPDCTEIAMLCELG